MQAPIADITWPEIPITVHAFAGTSSNMQLLGITANGTIHVIDLTFTATGMQKDWSSIRGVSGTRAIFLGERGEGGVCLASKKDKEWRVIGLIP